MRILLLATVLLLPLPFGFADESSSPPTSAPATQPAPVSEDQAKQLAVAFAQKAKLDWGQPASISTQNQDYWVIFPTPGKERAMLGPRTVVVNIATDKCSIQERE